MIDTPRSDATPHNVAELAMFCRKLERELNEANALNEELQESLTLAYMTGAYAAKKKGQSMINEQDDYPPYCPSCRGSGEGCAEGTTCGSCQGSGHVKPKYEADE